MGAYMKFSGYDALVFRGAARRWVYLYLHDGTAELRDAVHHSHNSLIHVIAKVPGNRTKRGPKGLPLSASSHRPERERWID
jgi:aldehyde:ferredoxin oxidoreductase